MTSVSKQSGKGYILFCWSHDESVQIILGFTAWNVSKYGVIYGLYFPVFSPNTGKYEPEIPPYLDTFYAVIVYIWIKNVASIGSTYWWRHTSTRSRWIKHWRKKNKRFSSPKKNIKVLLTRTFYARSNLFGICLSSTTKG